MRGQNSLEISYFRSGIALSDSSGIISACYSTHDG